MKARFALSPPEARLATDVSRKRHKRSGDSHNDDSSDEDKERDPNLLEALQSLSAESFAELVPHVAPSASSTSPWGLNATIDLLELTRRLPGQWEAIAQALSPPRSKEVRLFE